MKKCIILIAMLSIALSSCGSETASSLEENIPLPQTAEVFLIDRYVNHAWGYDDRGAFMDTKGAVYAFDFGMQYSHGTSEEQMLEKFNIIRENLEPVMIIDHDTVAELYAFGSKIDPDSRFHSKSVACDAGSRTLSFRNPDTGSMIVCTMGGDSEGKLDDSHARKFVKLCEKTFHNVDAEYTAPLVYTADDIRLSSIACDTEMSGKIFLSSDEQLRILAKQSNTSIDDILNDYADYEQERYVYFVELNAAPANAILCTGDSYQLAHTNGSGCCNVAAFPRSSGTFTADSIPCADGDAWQRIRDGDLNFDPDFVTGEAYGLSEPAMRKIWEEFGMHGFAGLYISDAAKYEEFIDSCDRCNIMENGNIRSILEENGALDFDKFSLCIKLDSHNDDTRYEWQRTEIGDGYIVMGSSISLNWDNTEGEGTLAYALIPKTYLSKETYTVSCCNKRRN